MTVYQMLDLKEQVLDEGNCSRATACGEEACGEEACGWLGKRRVCEVRLRIQSPLGTILVKAARLRTETSYKAGSVRRASTTSRSGSQSTDQGQLKLFARLDQWLRRCIRMCYWKQWRRPKRLRQMLIRLTLHRVKRYDMHVLARAIGTWPKPLPAALV